MDSYAWFKDLVQKRRSLDDATLAKVSDGRVFTGRQGLALKLVDELGDERTAVAWLAKEKKIDPKTPVRDFRLRDRFGDLPFLHTAAISAARRRRARLDRPPLRGARARSRPSSGSTLTVYWPFGTLPLPTRRRPKSAAGQGGRHPMIKSELVQRIAIAEPASLSARRREHRQRDPRRDHRRHGARRPRRAARLRRLLGQEPAGPHRPQSAHRRACLGRQEGGAVLQDRQGNARAAQSLVA